MRTPPRPRSLFPPLLLLLVIAASRPAPAADFAAAFLEVGIGERAIGLGQAFTAVADDASAGYWNPAGLVYVDGRVLLSHQPLSLDRQHLSISFALSIRDELGFGLTMFHAGVDDITARDATGMPMGDIDDANNAYLVSVGRAIGQRLAVGVSMKVIRQQITAPVGSRSTLGEGKANGVDLGMRYRLGEHTVLAAVVRNLKTELNWKVDRGNQRTSSTKDAMPTTLAVGASHRPLPQLLVTADLVRNNLDTVVNAGAEWQVSPVLALRSGLHAVGGSATDAGSFTAGLTLRPMRQDALQFHYAFATDPVGTGGRTALGIEVIF